MCHVWQDIQWLPATHGMLLHKEQAIVLSWQAMRKIYNLQILHAILTEK